MRLGYTIDPFPATCSTFKTYMFRIQGIWHNHARAYGPCLRKQFHHGKQLHHVFEIEPRVLSFALGLYQLEKKKLLL